METRVTTRGVRGAALAAILLFVVVSHAILATVYVPVHSDLGVYQRYAAAVERGLQDGTSFSVARDQNIRDSARRDGLPEPAPDAFLVEYPPLAVVWMAAAGIGTAFDENLGQETDGYKGAFRLAMFAVELLLLLVLVRWAASALVPSSSGARVSPRRIAVYGACSLILGNLLFDRLDLVLGALLLVSVVLLVRGSWLASFLLLAVAINFKASPIALAPLWILASLPAGLFARIRFQPGALVKASGVRAIALVGLAMIVFLPFLITEGTRALDFLRFRALQGVHVESIPGSVLLVLHEFGLPLEVTFAFGTYELQTPFSSWLAVASPLVLLVGVAIVLVLYVRAAARPGTWNAPTPGVRGPAIPAQEGSLAARSPSLLLAATVATLLLTLVTSKLLSPQYLIWILPLVPLLDIGPTRTRAIDVWFLITCIVTTAVFPYLLGRTLTRLDPAGDGYLDPTLLGVGLIVVRNTLLVWLAWLAVRALLRPTPNEGSRSAALDEIVPSTAGTATGG